MLNNTYCRHFIRSAFQPLTVLCNLKNKKRVQAFYLGGEKSEGIDERIFQKIFKIFRKKIVGIYYSQIFKKKQSKTKRLRYMFSRLDKNHQ